MLGTIWGIREGCQGVSTHAAGRQAAPLTGSYACLPASPCRLAMASHAYGLNSLPGWTQPQACTGAPKSRVRTAGRFWL